jgi:Txe/YoeB family toxin of Txe-Axe toxin-antitoxin module
VLRNRSMHLWKREVNRLVKKTKQNRVQTIRSPWKSREKAGSLLTPHTETQSRRIKGLQREANSELQKMDEKMSSCIWG